MAQVLAVADFSVDRQSYVTGMVITFAAQSVVDYLATRRVVSKSATDVAAAIAAGATQVTHQDLVDSSQSPFSTSIPLDGSKYMKRKSVTGPLAFVPKAGAVRGGQCYLRLVADGVNTPTFPGFKQMGGSLGYDSTAGIDNQIVFFFDGDDYFYGASQIVGAVPTFEPIVVRLVTKNGLTESGDSNGWIYTPTAVNAAFAASQAGVSDKKIPANADGYFQVTVTSIAAGGGPDLALQNDQAALPYNQTLIGVYINSTDNTYKVSTAGTGNQVPDVVIAPAVGDVLRIGRSGASMLAQVSKDGGSNFTTIKTWTVMPGDLYLNAIGALPANPITGLRGGNVVVAAAAFAASVVRLTTKNGMTESGDAVAGWNYTPTGTNAAFSAAQAGTSDKKIAADTDGWFQVTLGAVNAGGGPDIALQTSQVPAAYNGASMGIYVNTGDNTYKVSTGATGNQAPDVALVPTAGDIVRIGRQGADAYVQISQNGGTTWTRVKTWAKGAPSGDLYCNIIGALATNPANNIRGGNVA